MTLDKNILWNNKTNINKKVKKPPHYNWRPFNGAATQKKKNSDETTGQNPL